MDTPFFGGSSEGWSSNLSNSRCMNLYPELVETKDGKQVGGFYSTPGLKQWATVANGGKGIVRGLHYVSATNLLLVVCGNTLTSITQNGVQTVLGTIKSVVGAVSIIDNGTQYFLSDGVNAYVYASGALTVINTLPPNPGITTYQDNLGLVAIRGTNQFYQSNIGDLSTWDALSFSSADSEPSPIMAIISLFRQVWVFKQQSVEIWNNAGLNGFAFQRMEGAYLEIGCISPYSVCQVGDRLIWLGQDDQGQGVIYITNGYAGQRISTHPVEYAMRSYGKISDAVAYSYQQAGHLFYVISFPTGNATWVYDRTTGFWHERGEYINGSYRMHDSSGHALFNGLNLVGSASSTKLYSLDINYPVDDLPGMPLPSNPKRMARRWRGLSKAVNGPVRFQSLRVDMQTGDTVKTKNSSGSEVPQGLLIEGKLGNQFYGSSVSFSYTIQHAFTLTSVVISSGSLPTGLSINGSGQVTGVPTATGTYSWSVTVTDVLGNTSTLNDSCQVLQQLQGLFALVDKNNPTHIYFGASPASFPISATLTNSASLQYGNNIAWSGSSMVFGAGLPPTQVVVADNQSFTSSVTSSAVTTGAQGSYITKVGSILFQREVYSQGVTSTYAYSLDNGHTWSVISSPNGVPLVGIARLNNGTWIAMFVSGATQNIYYSNQSVPTTWINSSFSTTHTMLFDMACDGNTCIVMDNVNNIYKSTDGNLWIVSNVASPNIHIPMSAAAGGSFVFQSDVGYVAVSHDSGVTWSKVKYGTATNTAVSIQFQNGMYYATDAGQQGVCYSTDYGNTWNQGTLPAGVISYIAGYL